MNINDITFVLKEKFFFFFYLEYSKFKTQFKMHLKFNFCRFWNLQLRI